MADESSVRLRHEVAGAIEPYRQLMIELVKGHLSAETFESAYLQSYRSNRGAATGPAAEIVFAFFAEVDAFVADEGLRFVDDGDIGPEELRAAARALLVAAGVDLPTG